ncbi:MAG: hypothetical protein HN802_07075 [Candidatus Jacksonbacteria bacterium]|jgi:hypothetical protein|nr:hypothetical protein [Candidatus Jacksonbacteria bacterium]
MSKKAQATFKKQAGVMDAVHMGLDVAGMVPLFGEVADGINAGLYAARGQ